MLKSNADFINAKDKLFFGDKKLSTGDRISRKVDSTEKPPSTSVTKCWSKKLTKYYPWQFKHNSIYFKRAQKSQIFLGYFFKQICWQELSKIAQSDHTDYPTCFPSTPTGARSLSAAPRACPASRAASGRTQRMIRIDPDPDIHRSRTRHIAADSRTSSCTETISKFKNRWKVVYCIYPHVFHLNQVTVYLIGVKI